MARVQPTLISSSRRAVSPEGRGSGGLGETLVEFVTEALERVASLLEPALPGGQEVVRGHSIGPSREQARTSERAEAGHDPDEDLLGRIAGVLRMPQHP